MTLLISLVCLLLTAAADAGGISTIEGGRWINVWTAMPQLTEYSNLPSGTYNTTPKFDNTTIRQTIKLDLPASILDIADHVYIRLRISNAFGTTPLNITNLTIARPLNNTAGTSVISSETLQVLNFDKGMNIGVNIPPSALAVTDPVALPISSQFLTYQSTNGSVLSGSLLTISTYMENGQDGDAITSHPGSRTTSFLSPGNQVSASNVSSDATAPTQALAHWYFIAAIEAWLPRTHSTCVVVGDSITDGRGSTDNMNNRWPDLLFSRLQQNSTAKSVLSQITISNQGAGGNRILADGLGPSALSRYDRDVLSQSGVKYVVIFEGVNDIGTAATDQRAQQEVFEALIAAYRQFITRGHAQRLPVFGATITPFGNLNTTLQPYSDPAREATRLKLNHFIRTSGEFDGVIDFDAAVRNPQNLTMLNPIYDSGDGLHPNVDGYEAMSKMFPVDLFERHQGGVDGF